MNRIHDEYSLSLFCCEVILTSSKMLLLSHIPYESASNTLNGTKSPIQFTILTCHKLEGTINFELVTALVE